MFLSLLGLPCLTSLQPKHTQPVHGSRHPAAAERRKHLSCRGDARARPRALACPVLAGLHPVHVTTVTELEPLSVRVSEVL